MNSIHKILDTGIQKLKKGNISSSVLDAEIILSNILNIQKEDLILEKNYVSNDEAERFYHLINRRLKKEPIAYVLNKKEFWNDNFLSIRIHLFPDRKQS